MKRATKRIDWRLGGGYTNLIAIIAAFALAFVFALFVLPSILNSTSLAKDKGMATQLQGLQASVSLFYNDNGYYPTGSSTQPSTADAYPLCITPYGSPTAFDNTNGGYTTDCTDTASQNFVKQYLTNTPPSNNASNFNLITGNTVYTGASTLYYGVTVNGVVFATQSAPSSSTYNWSTSGGTSIITTSSASNLSGWPNSAYVSLTSGS